MKRYLTYACISAVVAIAISFGLLAIPGQFYDAITSMRAGYHTISGYELIFNVLPEVFVGHGKSGSGPSALGIAALVMMVIALVGVCLMKVSVAFPLFGAFFQFLAGFFFLMMKPWGADPMFKTYADSSAVLWTSYVIGALLVITAIAIAYFTIKILREEKASPKASSNYSYLKK